VRVTLAVAFCSKILTLEANIEPAIRALRGAVGKKLIMAENVYFAGLDTHRLHLDSEGSRCHHSARLVLCVEWFGREDDLWRLSGKAIEVRCRFVRGHFAE